MLFRLRHAGLRSAHIGVGRAQIAAGVDGGDGHVHVGRSGVRLGAGQRGLGVFHRYLVVAGVQLGNHVASLHHLVLVDIYLGNLATDARADLDQVPVDLRVVGIFAEGGVPPDADGGNHQHRHHDDDDAPAAGLAAARLSVVSSSSVGLVWC